MSSVLKPTYADGVIIALPIEDPRTHEALSICEIQGIPVELILDSLTSRLFHSRVVTAFGVTRLVLTHVPQSGDGLALKRITDIVLSGLALLLLSPVLAVIALAVKLDDGGPVLFKQCWLRAEFAPAAAAPWLPEVARMDPFAGAAVFPSVGLPQRHSGHGSVR